MRHLAKMILLLLFLAPQETVAVETAIFADGTSGVAREGVHRPAAHGRKVHFMDGSVGFVRPDGVFLFEKQREEPARKMARVHFRPREKAVAVHPPDPDWYGLSKPTGKPGERLWLGPADLLSSGDKTGKLLTINADGSQTVVQKFVDGSRFIDDPALPHLRRVLPDGTTLVLKRAPPP